MLERDSNGELLFPVRSAPERSFYAGYLTDRRQALVACSKSGQMIIAVFDGGGNLTEVFHQDLPSPRELLESGDLRAVYEDDYQEYLQRALGLSPGLIRIKTFRLHLERFGVYELPQRQRDFLENCSDSKFSDEDRQWFPEMIQQWKERGQFVLEWGNDFWLDSTGEVDTS
jgi:hypothetical protein